MIDIPEGGLWGRINKPDNGWHNLPVHVKRYVDRSNTLFGCDLYELDKITLKNPSLAINECYIVFDNSPVSVPADPGPKMLANDFTSIAKLMKEKGLRF